MAKHTISSPPRRSDGESARALALAHVGRARAGNAWLRGGSMLVATAAAVGVTGEAIWFYWLAALGIVLLVERRANLQLLRRCEDGDVPARIPWLIGWTFVQSIYGNLLAISLWFTPYVHGRTLAMIYLIAGLANAVTTTRAYAPLAFAALAPTMGFMIGLPVAEYLLHDMRQPLDLTPLLGTVLFIGFGVNLWFSLRGTERARTLAETAAVRERDVEQAANAARAETGARLRAGLRTPLAALSGAVEQLRRTAPPAELRAHMSAIQSAIETVNQAIQDMTDARAASDVSQTRTPCDPREQVRAVVNAFRAAAHDKGLELFLDMAPNAPAFVEIDGVRLRQALMHVLDNAVRFTLHGGVRVRLQAQNADRDGWVRLAIVIADTGPGLSRSQLAQIMTRGAPEEESTRGMGLALELADQIGARITAKSELGAGSVFTLSFDARVSSARRHSAA